jgi:hypothetical protein
MLREANTAATAGDWTRVSAFTQPLLVRQLDRADLAEAHRLAGLAAYFERREPVADAHFFEYLKLDLDGRLDPALYPPEVVGFFDDVRAKHATELRALRPKPKRYWLLNFVPPLGQFQNGDRGKGFVFGSLLGVFAITNVTTYFLLRSWCTRVTDPTTGLSSATCDDNGSHAHAATTLRSLNLFAGVGLIVTYVWGVYDGVRTYRRRSSAQVFAPFATPSGEGVVVGIHGNF